MVVRLFVGIVVFLVVLAGGSTVGADGNVALVVAAAAAFGSLYVTVKLPL
jgi:hypothetical protein